MWQRFLLDRRGLIPYLAAVVAGCAPRVEPLVPVDAAPVDRAAVATWTAATNRATNAPFTVLDGSTTLGTVQRNQELAPNDFGAGGAMWEDLGTFTIVGNTIVVRLTNAANELVVADAIRIERVS